MNTKFPKKNYKSINDFYVDYTENLSMVLNEIDLNQLDKASKLLEKTIFKKKNIFVCGNGGSAAIANHLVCDYIKLMRKNTKLKPKVISLSTNVELITAISNDFSYDKIFSDQLSYLATKEDLLFLISSSGNSKNIINAVKFCKKNGVKTIGLSGFKGGYLSNNTNVSLHFNCENYGLSEDSHHIVMHILMQYLRQKYLDKNIKETIF